MKTNTERESYAETFGAHYAKQEARKAKLEQIAEASRADALAKFRNGTLLGPMPDATARSAEDAFWDEINEELEASFEY